MSKNFKDFSKDMNLKATELEKVVRDILPRIAAVEGTNFFKQSWAKQGFDKGGVIPWQKRKAPKKMTSKGKPSRTYTKWKKKEGRPILYSHGSDKKGTHLKDSIRAQPSSSRVVWATDKPYAQVHNEGGRAGRGKGFRMPKRQFMGSSPTLDKRIQDKFTRAIDKIMKK